MKSFKQILNDELDKIAKFNNIDSEQLKQIINSKLTENMSTYTYPVDIKTRTPKDLTKNVMYHEFYDKVYEKEGGKLIVSANGSIFAEEKSPAVLFIEDKMAQRKIAKKKMFEAAVAGNEAEAEMQNINQLTLKEAAK